MAFTLVLIYTALVYLRPFERTPVLAPYRIMLVMGLLTLLTAILSIPLNRPSARALQPYLLILFVGCIAISRVVGQGWLGGAIIAAQEFAVVAVYFFSLYLTANSFNKLRLLFCVMALGSLVQVVEGIMAYHYGYGGELFFMTQITGYTASGAQIAINRIRGLGFFNDPNDLAQSLLTVIPFIALAWKKRAAFWNLAFVILPIATLLYGVLLTRSRGAALSLFVLILFALRRKMNTTMASITAVIPIVALVAFNLGAGRAFSTSDESISGRFEAWSQGLQLLKQSPIFGVGYHFFTDYHQITAHNSFVLCFSELGLAGLLVWVGMLYVTILELSQITAITGTDAFTVQLRRYAVAAQLSMISFLTSAWFLSRTYVLTLYLLIAVSVCLATIARRAGKIPELPPLPTLMGKTFMWSAASIAMVYLSVRFAVR